jgi:hypothetical protein
MISRPHETLAAPTTACIRDEKRVSLSRFGSPVLESAASMATRVFRTRRGRITFTDETLTYEPKREPPQRVARADITLVRVVTIAYWSIPVRTDVLIHHRGGALTIPQVGVRTAEALKRALGFYPLAMAAPR